MRLLLALSFSLAAAQPALRGASEGTRALLFSNFVDSSVETVAPTAAQTAAQTTSAGSCKATATRQDETWPYYICDFPADLCIDDAYPEHIWYPPGYTVIEDEDPGCVDNQDCGLHISDNEGCCHCDASCDHDAETGDDCASKYYILYCELAGSC